MFCIVILWTLVMGVIYLHLFLNLNNIQKAFCKLSQFTTGSNVFFICSVVSFRKVKIIGNVLGLNTKGFLFQSWRRSSKTLWLFLGTERFWFTHTGIISPQTRFNMVSWWVMELFSLSRSAQIVQMFFGRGKRLIYC